MPCQFEPSDVIDLKSAVGLVHQWTGHRPHIATIFRWAWTGRLPTHRVGRRVFTTRQALRALLDVDSSRPRITRDLPSIERRGHEAAARIARKARG